MGVMVVVIFGQVEKALHLYRLWYPLLQMESGVKFMYFHGID